VACVFSPITRATHKRKSHGRGKEGYHQAFFPGSRIDSTPGTEECNGDNGVLEQTKCCDGDGVRREEIFNAKDLLKLRDSLSLIRADA